MIWEPGPPSKGSGRHANLHHAPKRLLVRLCPNLCHSWLLNLYLLTWCSVVTHFCHRCNDVVKHSPVNHAKKVHQMDCKVRFPGSKKLVQCERDPDGFWVCPKCEEKYEGSPRSLQVSPRELVSQRLPLTEPQLHTSKGRCFKTQKRRTRPKTQKKKYNLDGEKAWF